MSQTPLRGRCRVPADKSISHRAALLSLLAPGTTVVRNFSPAGDCRASLEAVSALGAQVTEVEGRVNITVPQSWRASEQRVSINCRRSGTTMRLLAGVLSPRPGNYLLRGDPQLLRRPMGRVAQPLSQMGAHILTRSGGLPPLEIAGRELHGQSFTPEVASAQVKSALLLAGAQASGCTSIIEPHPTRDHTERMLAAMGAALTTPGPQRPGPIEIRRGPLHPLELTVPGDPSSAAYLAAASALLPGSDVTVEDVGSNPSRRAFFDLIGEMGVVVDWGGTSLADPIEPASEVRIRHAATHGVQIGPDRVPSLIDELPLVALLATQAEGQTVIRGAAELRVKESDRIAGTVSGLRQLGARIEEFEDGLAVMGPTPLRGGHCDSMSDHRLAMTFSLAALIAHGPVSVSGEEFVADSFPGFHACLRSLA